MEHQFSYRGREVSVSTSRVDAHTLEMTVDGATHVVRVLRHDRDRLVFEFDGAVVDTTHAESKAGVEVAYRGRRYVLADPDAVVASAAGGGASDGILRTPMPGKVIDVRVAVGDAVTAKQRLLVLESMKMQNDVVAPFSGHVAAIHFAPGDNVDFGDILIELAPDEAST